MTKKTNFKIVRLTEEAYETLEKRNREHETLSETVERLTAERPIRELVGRFTDNEIEEWRTMRTESYEAYTERREREGNK